MNKYFSIYMSELQPKTRRKEMYLVRHIKVLAIVSLAMLLTKIAAESLAVYMIGVK